MGGGQRGGRSTQGHLCSPWERIVLVDVGKDDRPRRHNIVGRSDRGLGVRHRSCRMTISLHRENDLVEIRDESLRGRRGDSGRRGAWRQAGWVGHQSLAR